MLQCYCCKQHHFCGICPIISCCNKAAEGLNNLETRHKLQCDCDTSDRDTCACMMGKSADLVMPCNKKIALAKKERNHSLSV